MIRGLILRIQPSGSKTYYFEYARGKRVRLGSSSLTLTRARLLARKQQALADEGVDISRPRASGLTLGAFLQGPYAEHFSAHHRNCDSLANLSAFSAWSDWPLSQINLSILKDWRKERLESNTKPATINRNVSALKTALNFAVESGELETNPIKAISALKVEMPNRVRYLSEQEEKRLRTALDKREARLRKERKSANRWRAEREYAPHPDLSNMMFADHLKPMVLLTINTGMRRGELFNLRWADITDNKTLTIQRSKSGRARHLPLNTEAQWVLENWRPHGTENWVFENKNRPFNNVNKAWGNLLTDAKVQDFRWHDLRHHFASKLVAGSVALNTVRELMGHSDLKMTLRYAHLAPGHMREAVEVLNA